MVVSETEDLRSILDQNIIYIRCFLAKSERIVIRKYCHQRSNSRKVLKPNQFLNHRGFEQYQLMLGLKENKKQNHKTRTKYTEASTQKANSRSLDKRQK
ncbi:hypothetical protein SESBI_22117 [Sesbania bispinosa]|nr:hypothetical protein SESBI_22117 [Sesbania bispinosa]